MIEFEIDNQYLTSITKHKSWGKYDGQKDVTPEQLIEIIKGNDRCSSTWSEDHPEFTKLRETLGRLGYINIVRDSWNGDTVTAPFRLNGKLFQKNKKFVCAAAMSGYLRYML